MNNNKAWLVAILLMGLFTLGGCNSDSSDSNSAVAGVSEEDSDGDGISDTDDNCASLPNPGQADLDGDGVGDACDADLDGDDIENSIDECPSDPNNNPGCAASEDTDGDGIVNSDDNCPFVANPGQEDADGDGIGDACDDNTDTDGDTVPDPVDNCPDTANTEQTDTDGDGIGDVCDPADNTDASSEDAYACGLAASAPYKPFIEPAFTAQGSSSATCLLCGVLNPGNATNTIFTDPVTLNLGLNVGGSVTLAVGQEVVSEVYEAPNRLGIAVARADAFLNASLLEATTVRTLRDGQVVETFNEVGLLNLDLVGVLNESRTGFLVFDTQEDFDSIEVEVAGVLDVGAQVNIFAACASPDAVSTE